MHDYATTTNKITNKVQGFGVTSMESKVRATHKESAKVSLYLQNKVLGYYRINAPSIGYYRISRLARGLIIFSRETTMSAVSHDNKSKTGSWIVSAPQLRKAKSRLRVNAKLSFAGSQVKSSNAITTVLLRKYYP